MSSRPLPTKDGGKLRTVLDAHATARRAWEAARAAAVAAFAKSWRRE
jgi:hypothetical protein